MKRNPETGLYEATKFIALTNEELVGTGTTREAAKSDLKKKLESYRKDPMSGFVSSGTFKSPGYSAQQDQNTGITHWRKQEGRQGRYWSRKGLEETCKKRREEETQSK